MPPTTRILVRRDLHQALIRLKGIQDYLVRSGHLYHHDYPQIYESFCVLLALTEEVEKGLRTLRENI